MKFDNTDWTITITQDTISVPIASEPDPHWREVDGEGHVHTYASDGSTPTLSDKELPPVWCNDCEEDHYDAVLVCRECLVPIAPGVRLVDQQMHVTDRVEITGSVKRTNAAYDALMESYLTGERITISLGPYILRNVLAISLTMHEIVSFIASGYTYYRPEGATQDE